MSPLRWNCLHVITLLLLISTGRADVTTYKGQHVDADEAVASMFPYWEYLLREFIFKTISPPPPANNALYKRLLEAPFFGGPFPSFENSENALLSKGDVYHLPNGHWLLCQEGCVDCDVCSEQREPTVKWTLRRIRQQTASDEPRYDLQLTIVPQVDGSFHMRNLSPRSYIYVTPQTDRPDTLPFKMPWMDDGYPNSMVEPNAVGEQPGGLSRTSDGANSWNHEEINETLGPASGSQLSDGRDFSNDSATTWKPEDSVNISSEPSFNYPGPRFVEPRLILGTDQYGQKHLIHVVPASNIDLKVTGETVDPSLITSGQAYSTSSSSSLSSTTILMPDAARPDKNPEGFEMQSSYERVFHRVLDSLNTHKQVIERFLSDENEDRRGGKDTRANDEPLEKEQLGLSNDSADLENYDQDLDNAEEHQQFGASQNLLFVRKPTDERKRKHRRLCPSRTRSQYSKAGRSRGPQSLPSNSTSDHDGVEKVFARRAKVNRGIGESGRSSIDDKSTKRYEVVGEEASELKGQFEKVKGNADERETRGISQESSASTNLARTIRSARGPSQDLTIRPSITRQGVPVTNNESLK